MKATLVLLALAAGLAGCAKPAPTRSETARLGTSLRAIGDRNASAQRHAGNIGIGQDRVDAKAGVVLRYLEGEAP